MAIVSLTSSAIVTVIERIEMSDLDKRLREILADVDFDGEYGHKLTNEIHIAQIKQAFAEWTIKNVEHGIYIPLPSPEATNLLVNIVNDEVVRELEKVLAQQRQGLVLKSLLKNV